MPVLLACPFCRELFAHAEATTCPSCGLPLVRMDQLPLSHDARAEGESEEAEHPDLQPLPWYYPRRGRAGLALFALLGLVVFFAPWVDMTSPELQVYSGFALARRMGWTWAAAAAWFVLFPVVLTRRTIDRMRGARVAAAFLSAVPAVTASVLLSHPPHGHRVPIRFDWGWGIYATLGLGLLAALVSLRFGGTPSAAPLRRDETITSTRPSPSQRWRKRTLH